MADADPGGKVFVFLGPPGVGKGTQAVEFAERWGLPHVATGDILREAAAKGTPLGLEAKEKYMDRGVLVPDEVVMKLAGERIAEEDCRGGALLDGFPRTPPQAEFLDGALERLGLRMGRVFYLDASEEVVIERLGGRRTCPRCRANYHLQHLPPKSVGICDRCKTPLIWRDDDRPETVRKRMRVYRDQTADLVGFYERRGLLARIDASGDVESIRVAVEKDREASER